MSWNETGQKPNKSGEDAPPDLEDMLKKLFGFKRKAPGQQHPSGDGQKIPDTWGRWLVVGLVVIGLLWALSGLYIVKPAEEAAILRFGKYLTTTGEGPHWAPRFIDTVIKRNVDQQQSITVSGSMLTSGENLVDVQFVVQYRINNLRDYLFNTVAPDLSLQQILDSAVRQVVGTSILEDIITIKRAAISEEVKAITEKLVQQYQLGIEVMDVKMLSATVPAQVKDAFYDVIKAREDNKRFQNEAETYANSILPIAKGKAQRYLQEADAYRQQQILQAKGAVAGFEAILPQYEQAQEVTATRLYFNTMSDVLSHSKVVLVDNGDKGGNMFYLPLDQLMKTAKAGSQQGMSSFNEGGADNISSSTSAMGGSDSTTASTNAASNAYYRQFLEGRQQ